MGKHTHSSPSGYKYVMAHSTENNSYCNVSSNSNSNVYSDESPKTKFGEWLDEFNDMQVSPPSNESSAKSSRSQIEISKSGVFMVEDNCERYTPESSPVHFTPRDCWVEDERPPAYNFSSSSVGSPAFVFNSSGCSQSGYNTSSPYNKLLNFQASPMQNVPRAKYVPNISPEVALEKCSLLRRIRLQTPLKKEVEPETKFSQKCTPRRSSLNDIRSHRLTLKQYSSVRRTQRERLSWPRSGRDCTNFLKENFSGNSSFYGRRAETTWEYPVEDTEVVKPKWNSYQLLGDSLLVRFAEQVLNYGVRMIQGTRTVGLCVSGQKIMDLYRKVSMKKYPVTDKIVLLIGTNDILQNTDDYDMRQTLKKLLDELLGNYASQIVLLTIPPIPKLQDREDQWQRIETYNMFIKSLKDERITIADINELYLETPRSCKLECFEKFYGDGERKDLIHLNYCGLKEIYNFLTEKKIIT